MTNQPLDAGTGQPVPSGIGVPSADTSADTSADDPGPTVTVGRYDNYAAAQQAVDRLSDTGFPVEHAAIVGTGLRLVERVLGRMTVGRAALAGAASGAWFGLFLGLLFSIFSVTNWLAAIIAGLLIGALWGAVFGAVAHAMTGGRRDFTSTRSLEASQYAVNISAEHADRARQALVQVNWRASGAS
jgi:hypothetical protein